MIASALVGLTVSATTSRARSCAVPSDEDRGAAQRFGFVLGGFECRR